MRLLVLAVAYILVWVLESTTFDAGKYYFYAVVCSLGVVIFCSQTEDKACIVYGWMQTLVMICYCFAIFESNDWAFRILYDQTLNLSLIVFCFELYMLSTGLVHGLFILYNRYFAGDNRRRTSDKFNVEAMQGK